MCLKNSRWFSWLLRPITVEAAALEQSMWLRFTADSASFYELPVESVALKQSMWTQENSRLNQLNFTTYLLNYLFWSIGAIHVTQEFTVDSANFYNLPVETAALEQSMWAQENSTQNQLTLQSYLLNQLHWSNPCESEFTAESANFYTVESAALEQSMWLKNSRLICGVTVQYFTLRFTCGISWLWDSVLLSSIIRFSGWISNSSFSSF